MPLEEPFIITDEFAAAIGHLTMAWATVEIPLDLISAILFTRCEGASKYQNEIPRAFERKATFIKKCLNNLDGAKALRGFVPLVQNAMDLSDRRHRLIHGLVDNFTPMPPDTILVRRILYETHQHKIEEHLTTLKEIRQLNDAVVELGKALTVTTAFVTQNFGIDPLPL